MNKIHLTPEQLAVCSRFRDTYAVRPTFKQYEAAQREMPIYNNRPKKINNTRPGFEKSEVRLTENFDALKDLPPGLAVCSLYDSGGNHSVQNAGIVLLRMIWNNWERRYDLETYFDKKGIQITQAEDK